jgi:hypothetical protein
MRTFSNPISDDVIDTRDLVKRKAYLEEKRDDAADARAEAEALENPVAREAALDDIEDLDEDEQKELKELESLEHEVGQWDDGNTLIAEGYWKEYVQQFAEDIGAYDPKAANAWPLCHIDWDAAADHLAADYSQVTYCGDTYYVRDC